MDRGVEDSYYRFLVDGKHVKYITIEAGLYDPDDMTFAPTLIPRLPIFPPGAWNVGHISADPSSGLPQFSKIVCEHLPGVTTTWHSTFIDYLDLDFDDTERLRSNVRHAMCKRLPGVALVVKFAQFDWEISYMEGETETYQWLQDHDIGPKFMGHLTEEGRVIAFLIERSVPAHSLSPRSNLNEKLPHIPSYPPIESLTSHRTASKILAVPAQRISNCVRLPCRGCMTSAFCTATSIGIIY